MEKWVKIVNDFVNPNNIIKIGEADTLNNLDIFSLDWWYWLLILKELPNF